jgi:DNA-directed RNA polymerase specialized sigma24 family protein
VAELARWAQQGNALAFACLVEQHQVALLRFCRQMLGDSAAAQDLVEETRAGPG